jgi:hypothetical protein
MRKKKKEEQVLIEEVQKEESSEVEWIPDPKDVIFDKQIKIFIQIASLIPLTIGWFYFWHTY